MLCRECIMILPPDIRSAILNGRTNAYSKLKDFWIDEGILCRHAEDPRDCKFAGGVCR